MSSATTYIGPYLSVKVPLVKRKRDRCKNPNMCASMPISHYEKGYCKKCGIDLKSRFTEDKEMIVEYNGVEYTWSDFDESILDLVFSDSITDYTSIQEIEGKEYLCFVLMPYLPLEKHHEFSGRPQNMPKMPANDLEEYTIAIDNVDVDADKAWFQDEYADPIEALKKALGEENVQFQWGLVRFLR